MENKEPLYYTVTKGDSLYKIAQQFNTTPDAIILLNHLKNNLLLPGQILTISEASPSYQEASYNSYQDFLIKNQGRGYLKIQVSTGYGVFPLADCQVVVSKIINQQKETFFKGVTEESGLIDTIELPAVISLDKDLPHFTEYTVEVSHPTYQQELPASVYIYDGIKSIQKVEMVPLAVKEDKKNG